MRERFFRMVHLPGETNLRQDRSYDAGFGGLVTADRRSTIVKSLRWVVGGVAAAAALIAVGGASPGGQSPAAMSKTLSSDDMDPNAQACTDFYQYAVGGWLEKNPIPSDRPRWGSFDEL